jgi:hypothetical protein
MAIFCILLMETSSTSEMSVNFYQTTRRNNPDDSHLHTRRHENLNSHCNEPSGSIKDGEFIN